jgi:LmbE family N-acetylglucosaminyl deacetylase
MSTDTEILSGATRVLVVAPHPDDETLGCGGLIAETIARGGSVFTLFVTDGGASHPESPAWPRRRLVAERQREAEVALELLGAGDQPRAFLRLRDSDMPKPDTPQWQSLISAIMTILVDFDPELVLLPWRRDPHCDHRDAHELLTAALDLAGTPARRLEYAIWLEELGAPEDFPLPGEIEPIELPIDDHRELKEAAVKAHATQLGNIDEEAPGGFVLGRETLARLIGPVETYFKPCG